MDWIGARLLLVALLGLVGYVILQPLIWRKFLGNKTPLPPGSPGLATELGVLVTIVSLALAGFGLTIYQIVERRIQQELQNEGETIKADLRVESARAIARIYIQICLQAILPFEEQWGKAAKPYSKDARDNPALLPHLENALRNARLAIKPLEELPLTALARPEISALYDACSANLAYYLAIRCRHDEETDDREEALRLVKGLGAPEGKYHRTETLAWVALRCAPPGTRDWERGLQRLRELLTTQKDELPDDWQGWRETVIARYRGALVDDGDLPENLRAKVSECLEKVP